MRKLIHIAVFPANATEVARKFANDRNEESFSGVLKTRDAEGERVNVVGWSSEKFSKQELENEAKLYFLG